MGDFVRREERNYYGMNHRKISANRAERVNTRFNRFEYDHPRAGRVHEYITDFGGGPLEEHETRGWIKCKLVHASRGSLIVPDQLYIRAPGAKPRSDAVLWIQPLTFFAPQLGKYDDDIWCIVPVDIAAKASLQVTFHDRDFERAFDDGSYLFGCTIRGPKALGLYATGSGTLGADRIPRLELYHHTTETAKASIVSSGEFWPSRWNIQGVEKKLRNIGYVYFTPLDVLRTRDDLMQVAMASDGFIFLLRDNAAPPLGAPTREMAKREALRRPQDILMLEVARSSTEDRRAALSVLVDADLLGPRHVMMHDLEGSMAIYYEVNQPFIQRVGVAPGANLPVERGGRSLVVRRDGVPPKRFDYIVAGDATSVEGLAAPYDEEDTSFILKVHKVPAGLTPLSFWFNKPNQDHFSGLVPEPMEFECVRPLKGPAIDSGTGSHT